ncbi:MAG: HNH endonuclease [Burkholderiales bacterium]|nr:HNH endonuclease [Burkholderiales bacterium]
MTAHRKREWELRSAKIADTLRRHGRIVCEVPGCGFDFARVYGELGAGYAHVHHLHPLAQSDKPRATRLADLAVVCANCHAMIHRNGACRDMQTLLPRHPVELHSDMRTDPRTTRRGA